MNCVLIMNYILISCIFVFHKELIFFLNYIMKVSIICIVSILGCKKSKQNLISMLV